MLDAFLSKGREGLSLRSPSHPRCPRSGNDSPIPPADWPGRAAVARRPTFAHGEWVCARRSGAAKQWPKRTPVPPHSAHSYPLAFYHPSTFARVGKPGLQTRIPRANVCVPVATRGGAFSSGQGSARPRVNLEAAARHCLLPRKELRFPAREPSERSC